MNVIDEIPFWTDADSVHVKLFDLQHQHLFKLLHRLETEMREGRARDRLYQFLADVADYAAEHFATEEAVMRAYEYPFRELHAQEHRKLASMIARFRDQEAAGDPAASLSVLRGMREWISGHLQVTDRPCTEFLNARGFR
jgi:hemerythrin-like metal-binding protein